MVIKQTNKEIIKHGDQMSRFDKSLYFRSLVPHEIWIFFLILQFRFVGLSVFIIEVRKRWTLQCCNAFGKLQNRTCTILTIILKLNFISIFSLLRVFEKILFFSFVYNWGCIIKLLILDALQCRILSIDKILTWLY